MGDRGNIFHRTLNAPVLERLLGRVRGKRILEIACGNGQFARRLARLGAQVLAVDASAAMLACARRRARTGSTGVEFRQVDATDRRALRRLAGSPYDAIVASMAFMDMVDLGPLAKVAPELLVPDGRLVFTVCHPSFNQTGARQVLDQWDEGGTLVERRSVAVSEYLTVRRARGLAMVGQPVPQWYFERPLSELLRPFLAAGFVLDGIEERAFRTHRSGGRPLSWLTFSEIPPLLGVRLRRPLP